MELESDAKGKVPEKDETLEQAINWEKNREYHAIRRIRQKYWANEP